MTLRDHTEMLKKSGRKALVAFLTAGYPDEKTFCDLIRTADQVGCDIIEVGIPFSDPIADGPRIQQASQRALERGMSLDRALAMTAPLASAIRAPIVFMCYYNPILRMTHDAFAARAVASGVEGVIVPDMSFEESATLRTDLARGGLTYVDLLAPTSSDERVALISKNADGFLYLVSITGVTGDRSPEASELKRFVGRVRAKTDLPLYIGFGISDREKASTAAQDADGVIIGSKLIELIQSKTTASEQIGAVRDFLARIRTALDEG